MREKGIEDKRWEINELKKKRKTKKKDKEKKDGSTCVCFRNKRKLLLAVA